MRREDEIFGGGPSRPNALNNGRPSIMLPVKRYKQESDSDEDDDDEDEDDKYNQEMFRKRKAELERQQHSTNVLQHLLHRRKSSSGGESSSDEEEEEDEIGDMGLFGERLQKFKALQAEKKHSPHKEEGF